MAKPARGEMDARGQKNPVWAALAALVAIMILFGAPATHAQAQPCPTVHVGSHQTEHAGSPQHAEDRSHGSHPVTTGYDKACCASVCAACVSALPAPDVAAGGQAILVARFGELQDHLLGQVPSPGLEPPRSAG
ncbi:hypothetical protein M8R20_04850 [Pseudomonas sp. R2.Fl]|nr:hypothetical protein [Pseudomonas sp. R2.Fl]